MRFLRKAAVVASLSTSMMSLIVAAPQAAAQVERTHEYHLASQPLSSALRAVARASGTSIAAPAQIVSGHQAPALSGVYTAQAAVAALLAGSGLHARPVGGGLIIEPDAGSAATDTTDQILVTGSQIRGAPVTSPIIVLESAAMREAGATSLRDVIRALPQNFGGGQNPGISTNVPTSSGINVGSASTINLRGLGSDATLTLLDGHRLTYNGTRQGIDVSAIPFAMVERVEVVGDGASALYGSDAVAGVANIVLRKDFQGLETSANIGGATDGGDFQQQYGVVAGRKWSGGGLVAAYEYASNTDVMSNDRTYAAVRPGVMLYPALHHHAVALTAHQSLTDQLTFEVDALYNKRWSLGGYASNSAGDRSVSHVDLTSTSRSVAVAPSLKLDLANGWRLALSGVYGTETVRLANNFYTRARQTSSVTACYCNSGSSVELAGDGGLFTLPGGTVKLAVGAGYRSNTLVLFRATGDASNIDATQTSTYAYGELSIPLVSGAQGVAAIDHLNLSGALRYERYPGVASVVTPKLGLIYAPIADLAIKGSWGRSFRAPTLYQRYTVRDTEVYSAAELGGSAYPSTAQVMMVAGGSANLKPERAETWMASLDFQPHQLAGLRIQASYFATVYKDRIVTPITYSSQSLSNPLYGSFVTRAPSAGVIASLASAPLFYDYTDNGYDPAQVVALVDDSNINAGRQVLHGVDMLVDYRLKLGERGGQFALSGNLAYLTGHQQLIPGEPVTGLAGTLFNPPHWRGRGSVTWSRDGLTINATTMVIGGVSDVRYTPSPWISGMVTQDLTLRYAFNQPSGMLHGLTLSLSGQNIFNSQPTRIATTSYSNAAYDSTNYSPIGRYVGAGISKSW